MIRQFELVERVKAYDPGADEDLLNRAYVFAMKAHGSQMRASGDPYFSHPLEVAGILADLRLDSASIATALLHDVVEDTGVTLDEIRRYFGDDVARLVDGVTKLARIGLASENTGQAENLRKLVVAMSDDLRVLLVKLADRLHNMRTLRFIKDPDKRRRIAIETMEIYAPLAERIGMTNVKDELEDLAFAEVNPDARDSVLARLAFLRKEDEDAIGRIVAELGNALKEVNITAEVTGREKRAFSVWQKMQRKKVEFEQLADLMAFRVVVDTLADCYAALGLIHCRYPVVPGRFKDYISTPKPNGYRSLHTSVIGPERRRIEIQIRTRPMHDEAERGVAAHWQYKKPGNRADGRHYQWLRDLLEIIENAAGPDEFIEHTKLAMFQEQVFCFTPKGAVIALPRGSTPVDFAYAVHTDVGDTCVGAKINGRMAPLRVELQNGDQVEIVTSKAQVPSPTWERFVVTAKARSRIRRFVRTQQRAQYVALGKAMLEKSFRQESRDLNAKALDAACKVLAQGTIEDLEAAVGEGRVPAGDVVRAAYPGLKLKDRASKIVSLAGARRKRQSQGGNDGIPIRGLIPGMALHYAGCCHPLPGDRIVGIVTTGKGVTIHTIDCESLENYADEPQRWLDVSWERQPGESSVFTGRIDVTIANEPGSLSSLSTIIAQNFGNITNLKITNRSQDFFDMRVDIEVQDAKHLTNIIAALRAAPVVNSVERARG